MKWGRLIADWVRGGGGGRIGAEGEPKTGMDDQAVVDAYRGAHADIDLGDDSVLQEIEQVSQQ